MQKNPEILQYYSAKDTTLKVGKQHFNHEISEFLGTT
jgi:hypothetical protein